MFKMMPSAAAVTQPITKIFNPVQSSLLNPFGFEDLYSIQNPYGGFSTHLGSQGQNHS